MIHAENIYVDTEDGRFILVLEDGEDTFRIDFHDCALTFAKSVRRTLQPYADEAESARKAVASGMSRADYLDSPRPVRSRPVSVQDAIEAGYALDDPKSPGFHDRMVD